MSDKTTDYRCGLHVDFAFADGRDEYVAREDLPHDARCTYCNDSDYFGWRESPLGMIQHGRDV
jgi:hypothetical protein